MTIFLAHSRGPRIAARLGAVTALIAALVAISAGTASAHVQVSADSTTSGSFSALTFRVPNESPTAGTVKLSVQLPQDQPFLYVSTKPVPGWTASVTESPLPKPVMIEGTTITKAIRTVTWTASTGVQISAGQYQEFAISVGPLPSPRTVLLPAKQTYSDGSVVNWNQPTPESGEEPEHPAPALTVRAARAGQASQQPSSTPNVAAAASRSDDQVARWLAGAALVVAVVGVALAALSLRRSQPGRVSAGPST